MIDQAFLNLAIGLLILIGVNIVLGSINAIFEKAFDFGKFFKGIGKGVVITGCFIAVYYAGAINPDIIAVNVNGQELTILAAIYATVLLGYYFYAKQVIEKLATLINAKAAVKAIDEDEGKE